MTLFPSDNGRPVTNLRRCGTKDVFISDDPPEALVRRYRHTVGCWNVDPLEGRLHPLLDFPYEWFEDRTLGVPSQSPFPLGRIVYPLESRRKIVDIARSQAIREGENEPGKEQSQSDLLGTQSYGSVDVFEILR